MPDENDEVREKQVTMDSDDEEGHQVYSEMLQRINTEVAAFQAEKDDEAEVKQRGLLLSENRKESLPKITERLQSPPAKSTIGSQLATAELLNA